MSDEIKLYTLQEVAQIMKVHRGTIYRYVNSGKLKATKYGKEYRVTKESLESFIEHGKN